jgi:hypothetical protein
MCGVLANQIVNMLVVKGILAPVGGTKARRALTEYLKGVDV